jgi:hypothetical protein
MAHAYQLQGENPPDTSIADIRQQVVGAVAPYERVSPDRLDATVTVDLTEVP